MRDLAFVLALLMEKGVIEPSEAVKLNREYNNGGVNTDLGQMLSKVQKALPHTTHDSKIKHIDAKDLLE